MPLNCKRKIGIDIDNHLPSQFSATYIVEHIFLPNNKKQWINKNAKDFIIIDKVLKGIFLGLRIDSAAELKFIFMESSWFFFYNSWEYNQDFYSMFKTAVLMSNIYVKNLIRFCFDDASTILGRKSVAFQKACWTSSKYYYKALLKPAFTIGYGWCYPQYILKAPKYFKRKYSPLIFNIMSIKSPANCWFKG